MTLDVARDRKNLEWALRDSGLNVTKTNRNVFEFAIGTDQFVDLLSGATPAEVMEDAIRIWYMYHVDEEESDFYKREGQWDVVSKTSNIVDNMLDAVWEWELNVA